MRELKYIFWVDDDANAIKVKVKIWQEMIQIICPNTWNIENLKNISNDIAKMEAYKRIING